MLRAIERVLGEGELTREGRTLARVGYELTLYQEWHDQCGKLVAGDYTVEGHFLAPSDVLEAALGTSSPLTLHLDDGRRWQCYVVNTDGLATPADQRGFTHP
jgi:hypothetical protein